LNTVVVSDDRAAAGILSRSHAAGPAGRSC